MCEELIGQTLDVVHAPSIAQLTQQTLPRVLRLRCPTKVDEQFFAEYHTEPAVGVVVVLEH